MFSTVWSYVKMPFVWVKGLWVKFEEWVASWAPGWKTQIVAGLGTVGSLAASMQEYMTGLPLDKFVTANQVVLTTAVLFTLAFWFRRLSDYNE